jgi:hypothetical protein
MDTLIVVAAHGPRFAAQCRESLGSAAPVCVVDTGSGAVPLADCLIPGGHPTGAYLHAYEHHPADAYLFIQDSMVATTPDFLDHFAAQMPPLGAVAWGVFGLAWDSEEQRCWVADQFPGRQEPPTGIFGPVFYTNRATLDRLRDEGLLPRIPITKIQAQGSERAWGWAFHAAGLPVVGPPWDFYRMQDGSFPPFKKVWADRQ